MTNDQFPMTNARWILVWSLIIGNWSFVSAYEKKPEAERVSPARALRIRLLGALLDTTLN